MDLIVMMYHERIDLGRKVTDLRPAGPRTGWRHYGARFRDARNIPVSEDGFAGNGTGAGFSLAETLDEGSLWQDYLAGQPAKLSEPHTLNDDQVTLLEQLSHLPE